MTGARCVSASRYTAGCAWRVEGFEDPILAPAELDRGKGELVERPGVVGFLARARREHEGGHVSHPGMSVQRTLPSPSALIHLSRIESSFCLKSLEGLVVGW